MNTKRISPADARTRANREYGAARDRLMDNQRMYDKHRSTSAAWHLFQAHKDLEIASAIWESVAPESFYNAEEN